LPTKQLYTLLDLRLFIVLYKTTTQEPFNKLNTGSSAGNCFHVSVVEPSQANPIPDTGAQHVKVGVAVNAASQRFRDQLPIYPQWRDIVEVAAKIRSRHLAKELVQCLPVAW